MSSEPGLLVVMTGPSGAGKTTLSRAVMAHMPEVRFSISFTTRPARRGEIEGVDYHFVDDDEFQRRLADGEFLEHANVHGNWYGTHRQTVAEAVEQGGILLLDIDVQGAVQVRGSGAQAVFVFVLPPSLEALEQRLQGRATDSDEVIQRRLANARREMAQSPWFPYLVVNDSVDNASLDLEAVLRAERLRGRHSSISRRLDLAALARL